MRKFEITAKDVGRIAIDESGCEWEILGVREGVLWKVSARNDCEVALFDPDGGGREFCSLERRKPEILVAPKRWWNVYLESGVYVGYHSPTFDKAFEVARADIIARVYDHHWHGAKVGQFDEPEDET